MKLYIVVRNDLGPGAQIAQSVHAFREFIEEHRETEKTWYQESNTIVILAVKDEPELKSLMATCSDLRLPCSSFREPDRNNEFTAIAIGPSEITSKILAHLPLAGTFTGKSSVLD